MSASTITSNNQSVANRLALMLQSGFESYQQKGLLVFNDTPPTRKDEIFAISAHDGSFSVTGEGSNYPTVDILEVGSKTASQAVYKKKIAISELMKAFDNENAIMREAFKIGLDAAIRIDQVRADVLNNGFTTETTWDGLSLFNGAHNVGATGQTQRNLVNGALSDSTLNDAIVGLRNTLNHRGTAMPVMSRILVVPPALEKKAKELLMSTGNPESANNNLNTYNGMNITVVSWELLTSSTAWFLTGDKVMHELHSLTSIQPELEVRERKFTEHGGDEVRMQFALTAVGADYLGTQGSTGL